MRLKKRRRLQHYRMIERLSQQRIRARIRNKVREIKAAAGRAECGEKDPICLVFHHVDPKKKTYAIQRAVSSKVPWNLVLKEMAKCIILCMNCHAKLHEKLKRAKENVFRGKEWASKR